MKLTSEEIRLRDIACGLYLAIKMIEAGRVGPGVEALREILSPLIGYLPPRPDKHGRGRP
jgi:hypothetical protein